VHLRVGDYKFDNSNYAASAADRATIWSAFRLEDSYPLCGAISG